MNKKSCKTLRVLRYTAQLVMLFASPSSSSWQPTLSFLPLPQKLQSQKIHRLPCFCEPAGHCGLRQHFESFYKDEIGQNVGLCSPLRYTALPTYAASSCSFFTAQSLHHPCSTRRRLAMPACRNAMQAWLGRSDCNPLHSLQPPSSRLDAGAFSFF